MTSEPTLRAGSQATFRGHDGRIVTGRVFTMLRDGVYLVIGDCVPCATYEDGLYRFRDKDITERN